jgi:hypothetical protein
MLHNVFLPLISLLSGIISLKIDPKEDKAKAWMVTAVLVISAVATGVSGTLDDNKQQKESAAAKEQISQLIDTDHNLSKDVGTVKTGVFTLLAKWGYSNTTIEKVQQSEKADDARAQALPAQLTVNTRRKAAEKLTVEYFPKDFDGTAVKQALQEGGFEFKPGKPKNNLPTNSMWVGDSVSVDNIKFVALTLVRAGVQLRSIRRFRNGSKEKANLIEIGADPAMAEASVLAVEQIQSLTELPPRDLTSSDLSNVSGLVRSN